MLRLRVRARELSPVVLDYILCRHSGLPQRLHYEGQFHRCQGTSAKSAVSPAADSEYKPIKKLLVANRGKRCCHCFFTYWCADALLHFPGR